MNDIIADLVRIAQQVGAYHSGFRRGTNQVPTELLVELETAADAAMIAQQVSQREDLIDSLHAVFTAHGIASRADLPGALISDLIGWAAQKCREARRTTGT